MSGIDARIVGGVPGDPSEPFPRRLSRRLTPRHWVLLDVAIAVVVAVDAVLELPPGGPAWRYVAIGAVCLPLPWRRRRPVAVLAVITGAVAVSLAVHSSVWLVQVVTLAMYSTATLTPRRRSLAWLAGCLAAVLAGALIGASGHLPEALGTGLLLLPGGWLVGDNVRARRAYDRAQAERAAEREAERAERIRRAAVEERMHIARELHDSLAHAMSVITVRSGIARMLIDTQPDEARTALGIIEGTGRTIMKEMRMLLGVLRTAEETAGPMVGLDGLDELVERTSQAGVYVEPMVEGVSRPLRDSIDRSAYRIVQEALANVVRHVGPARVLLRIRYRPADLEIEIVDDGGGLGGPPAPPGAPTHGLVGMDERVRLFGGEFTAGPLPDGGFRVFARIPTHEAP